MPTQDQAYHADLALEMLTLDSIAKATPAFFAEYASDGRWIAYPWIKYISEVITAAIKKGDGRIIINVPPQHGKSLFVSKWLPVWYLVTHPKGRVILASHEAAFAAFWGRQVRDEIRDNPKIELGISQDMASASMWQTTAGGMMFTAGTGGSLTGKSGELMIIDDPVKNWAGARSPAYQQSAPDWYRTVFYTRRQPDATIIIIMTRWHEQDLTGVLLREQPEVWTHIKLPALAELNDPLGRQEGAPLCPERFTEADLAQAKRDMGVHWPGLYQQRPAAIEGGLLKREWLKYYTALPPHFDEMIQSWDMTFKETTSGSYVVGQVWGRIEARYYLVHQYRARIDFTTTIKKVHETSLAYPKALKKYIEDKANGPAIINALRGSISGLIPVQEASSKEARLSAVSGLFESGSVYIPSKEVCPWVVDFIEELVNFPSSAYDDQVDACSQALSKLRMGEAKQEFYAAPSFLSQLDDY